MDGKAALGRLNDTLWLKGLASCGYSLVGPLAQAWPVGGGRWLDGGRVHSGWHGIWWRLDRSWATLLHHPTGQDRTGQDRTTQEERRGEGRYSKWYLGSGVADGKRMHGRMGDGTMGHDSCRQ